MTDLKGSRRTAIYIRKDDVETWDMAALLCDGKMSPLIADLLHNWVYSFKDIHQRLAKAREAKRLMDQSRGGSNV